VTPGGTYSLADLPLASPSAGSSSSQLGQHPHPPQHQREPSHPYPQPPHPKPIPTPTQSRPLAQQSRPSASSASSASHAPPPARPPSPARSDDASSDAGEELPPSGLVAPLSSIHRLAEAASVRQHEPSTKRAAEKSGGPSLVGGPASKRVKFGEVSFKHPAPRVEEVSSESGLSRGQIHTYRSSLEAGIVTDEEARRLHEIYWSGADQYLSVFDPSTDTYAK
jgi:hypothetical protein